MNAALPLTSLSLSLLSLSCLLSPLTAAPTPSFGKPQPWAKPIEDYIAKGRETHPQGFNQGISALQVFDGRLWIGYGDANYNLGTKQPIEFRCFESPDKPTAVPVRVLAEGQGAPQRSPYDTGEEQIDSYRICDGVLYVAGVDSNDPDEAWTQAKPAPAKLIEGNLFKLGHTADGAPVWHKYRSVPGAEHLHDVMSFGGALYAVGSGSKDRVEWESGEIFRFLWKSTDSGKSFSVVHREMFPDRGKGDTRFTRLLATGPVLHVFGYTNPAGNGQPAMGTHLRMLADGALKPVTHADVGRIASLLFMKTWPLSGNRGIATSTDTSRGGLNELFLVDESGLRDIRELGGRQVLDHLEDPAGDASLLLVRDGVMHSVVRVAHDPAAEPVTVLELGRRPASCFALWQGALYVGLRDGQVLVCHAAGS